MNLQQAKITLEKINRLYQSMTLDSSIDEHEQQLMLNYIRQFYQAFSGEGLEEKPPKAIKKPRVIRKSADPAPSVTEIPVPDFKPEPIPEPAPEPVKVEQLKPVYTPPPPRPEPPVATKISDPELDRITLHTDDYDELFEVPAAKDLSDRLSSSPIRDLTKAISINEKILTRNELFGNDKSRFDEALKKLNSFGSFTEARPYLAGLASEYEWNQKNLKKKAQVFIKLVRRRYN